ncbi:MAG: hypothetical protein CBD16_07055 [Betaproteobacteria bacterium TMED156]|nr:MAG: hypothetical protein CBD16_07055 [Betaproteobacteria bacterium TMED156]|tara:strand:- start:483 stop:812 length:330 start_codon:yes stop_codon:yes gene_type:complete
MTSLEKKTTFVFKCFEKESADLKIRLRYDGLTQTGFFSSLMKMYICQDPLMTSLVSKIKENQKSMGKTKIYKSAKDIVDGQRVLIELGITESDKNNIFDIIESGTEEYE